MNTWIRRLICVGGTVLATGFGTAGMGCAPGTYTIAVRITPLSTEISITFTIFGNSDYYDLDGLSFIMVEYDGVMYRYYPTRGWFYNPATGELYQLDDPSWDRLRGVLRGSVESSFELSLPDSHSEEVTRTSLGFFSPMTMTGFGIPTDQIAITLRLEGDTPLPSLDVDRWSTLDRKLFVFPDGTVGSPDPMRLELAGNASDVLGYLAELGMTEGNAVGDDVVWNLVIDDDHKYADLFIEETLFITVPLN